MAKSRIIFKNQHYTACAMRDGSLIVSSNRKQAGVVVPASDAAEWLDALATAMDDKERHDLCRGLMNHRS